MSAVATILLMPTPEWRERLLDPGVFPYTRMPTAYLDLAGRLYLGRHAFIPTGLVLAYRGAVVREGWHRLRDVLDDGWGTTRQRWSWTERLGGGAWTVWLYTPDGPPISEQEPPAIASPVSPPLLHPWVDAMWAAGRGIATVVLLNGHDREVPS